MLLVVTAIALLVTVPVVAVGAALNVLAIASNGGVMPASAAALRISGIDNRAGFDNSAALAHAHLRQNLG
jgi:hypothetical protein